MACALRSDMVGIKAFEFCVEFRGKDAFLRGKLQRIGQRIVPLGEELLPVAAAALGTVGGCRFRLKPVFQVIAERPQQGLVGLGMETPHAVVFFLFFDQAQAALAGPGIEKQHADIHPLVADKVWRVSQDAIGAGPFSRRYSGVQSSGRSFSHGARPFRQIQFGNGWRFDLLASKIKSGTRARRRCSCSRSRSSAS
jgi:hypothetical protein